MKRSQIFEAEDGTTFETAAECRLYEKLWELTRELSDLTPDLVMSALDRMNVPLADAFERAGSIIAAKRRESGDLKRAVKKSDAFESLGDAMSREARARASQKAPASNEIGGARTDKGAHPS